MSSFFVFSTTTLGFPQKWQRENIFNHFIVVPFTMTRQDGLHKARSDWTEEVRDWLRTRSVTNQMRHPWSFGHGVFPICMPLDHTPRCSLFFGMWQMKPYFDFAFCHTSSFVDIRRAVFRCKSRKSIWESDNTPLAIYTFPVRLKVFKNEIPLKLLIHYCFVNFLLKHSRSTSGNSVVITCEQKF